MKLEDIGLCCPFYSNLIEILSISENKNVIEFNCSNKVCLKKGIVDIKQFLEGIKQNKEHLSKINGDICKVHDENYKSYCYDFNKHLCNKCLKKENHIRYCKDYIIEIELDKKELNIFEKLIEYYETKIEKLEKKKIDFIKELNNMEKAKKI